MSKKSWDFLLNINFNYTLIVCTTFLINVKIMHNIYLTDSSAISHKKHKKHKKKHKKKKDQGEDYAVVPEGGGVSGGVSGVGGPKIKLKLKIGGQTMGTKKYGISLLDP